MSVLLINNNLLSSIAFVTGGWLGFISWLSCVTSDLVDMLGLEGWTM